MQIQLEHSLSTLTNIPLDLVPTIIQYWSDGPSKVSSREYAFLKDVNMFLTNSDNSGYHRESFAYISENDQYLLSALYEYKRLNFDQSQQWKEYKLDCLIKGYEYKKPFKKELHWLIQISQRGDVSLSKSLESADDIDSFMFGAYSITRSHFKWKLSPSAVGGNIKIQEWDYLFLSNNKPLFLLYRKTKYSESPEYHTFSMARSLDPHHLSNLLKKSFNL